MKNLLIFLTVLFSLIFMTSCQTVSNKIDKKTTEEQRELSKWLNQPESELKIVF